MFLHFSLHPNLFAAKRYRSRCRSRWENLDRFQYRFQPIKFVNLVVPSPFQVLAMPCWRGLKRSKQLSMAANILTSIFAFLVVTGLIPSFFHHKSTLLTIQHLQYLLKMWSTYATNNAILALLFNSLYHGGLCALSVVLISPFTLLVKTPPNNNVGCKSTLSWPQIVRAWSSPVYNLTEYALSKNSTLTVSLQLRLRKTVHFSEKMMSLQISELIIHQIFSLARDWSKHVTSPNIPQQKLGNVWEYSRIFKTPSVAKNIWRIINTIASIWGEKMLGYLSLDIICSS